VHALNSLLQLPPHINIDFANLSFTKAIILDSIVDHDHPSEA
jgi:hypothetical protein